MPRISLERVRMLTLREIAEMWAPTAEIPVSLMLRELRYAVINIPRLKAGEGLFDVPPPDDQLPNPDERVDRQWLMEFCSKQGWSEPEFWSENIPIGPSFPGRSSIMRAIVQELEYRAEQGQLELTLAEQARQLFQWALQSLPGKQIPKPLSIENGIRADFRRLKAGSPDQ